MQRKSWKCSSCGREVNGPILNPERHCGACKSLVGIAAAHGRGRGRRRDEKVSIVHAQRREKEVVPVEPVEPIGQVASQEISRIKEEYAEQWHWLETLPPIQKALADNAPVRLGELAAMWVHGNYCDKETGRATRLQILAFIDDKSMRFATIEMLRAYVKSRLAPVHVDGVYLMKPNGHVADRVRNWRVS